MDVHISQDSQPCRRNPPARARVAYALAQIPLAIICLRENQVAHSTEVNTVQCYASSNTGVNHEVKDANAASVKFVVKKGNARDDQ